MLNLKGARAVRDSYAHGQRFGFSNNAAREIGRVADDGESKMPKMNTDLIGATSQGAGKK